METANIPKEEYEKMKMQLSKLKELEGESNKIILKKPVSDIAFLSEDSFAETWLNEKEDEAWREL